MPGTHTWTPAERRAALHFARSLDESHLEIARGVYRYPHASVEELINHMSDSREELSRLAVFDFKKQTMIAFFRDHSRIPTADLRMAVLRNTPVDELRGILYSYISQVCFQLLDTLASSSVSSLLRHASTYGALVTQRTCYSQM